MVMPVSRRKNLRREFGFVNPQKSEMALRGNEYPFVGFIAVFSNQEKQ